MSAINNFRFKSLADLQSLAESYKDTLVQNIQDRRDPFYEISEISREEFDNISTFLFNASIKDSKSIERNENAYSKDFSKFLKKYFEEYLSLKDIVDLKLFVNNYNDVVFNYFYNNFYNYVFGVRKEADSVDNFGFFKKNSDLIIERVGTLVDAYSDQTTTKPVEEWFKGSGTGGSSLTIKNFYNSYFKISKVVEAVLLIMLTKYESGGTFLDTTTTLSNSNFEFSAELFYNLNIVDFDFKDIVFDTKAYLEQTVNSDTTKLNYFAIRSTSGTDILSVPYQLLNSSDVVTETYNYITTANIVNGEITLDNLFLDLYKNLMTFIEEAVSSVNQAKVDDKYNLALSFFEDNNQERALLSNITQDIVEQSRLFYNKDSILENYYVTTTELEKNSASVNEVSNSLSGKQLLFIDVKGVDFSGDIPLKNAAVEAFGNSLIGSSISGEEGEDLVYKLTYTILYKELNPELRYAILSDIQEYKFARLFSSLNYSYEDVFASNEREYSYSSVNETLYRNYKESREIFKVDVAFNRYRLFNGNAYTARVANESEIIGYYVGDSTPASAFTNNYGSLDYHKFEIDRFLNIYQQTRDYYYKVLLNKSFINDNAYGLYEKLYISWVAIERFLTEKLDNLRDPDFFNSTDIFNFLESYGLGILNTYDFFLGSRDYKVNIIKSFATLNKLKGSKDIVDLMTEIFEVQDTTVEIEKFLLIEEVESADSQEDQLDLFVDGGQLKIVSTPSDISTGIFLYNANRVYYNSVSEEFVDKAGTTLSPQPSTDYYFDEENFVVYNSSMVAQTLALFDKPANLTGSGLEYDGAKLYLNGTEITSVTFISVIDTTPASVAEGSIYYVSSEDKFYIKTENGWSQLKVSSYYPQVIKDNIGEGIEDGTELGDILSVYDGKYFTENIYERKLYRYVYSSVGLVLNEVVDEAFTQVISLPKLPGVVDVPFYRLLINQSLMEKADLSRSPMIYQSSSVDEIYRDFRGFINEEIGYSDIAKLDAVTLTVKDRISISESAMKFVKVPYISDNGSREIQTNIGAAVEYVRFLEKNDTEKNDIYWTKENVPEATLKELGLDAVETKYLALTISENIYRRFAITRYLLASVEYLESVFIVDSDKDGSLLDESPILERLFLDSGANLFGEATFYDFFQAIKILFKTVLKLQQMRYDDTSSTTLSGTFDNYFGINATNFSNVLSWLSNNTTPSTSDFITDYVRPVGNTGSGTSYDKFNLYNKENEWFSFDDFKEYKKDQLDETNTKVLNETAYALKNTLFSTHKSNQDIVQQNSGNYVLELFENLNTIRIQNGDNLFNYFLSKYVSNDYLSYTNEDLYTTQSLARNVDRTELYYKIIEKMMQFPIDMLDGLLYGNYSADLNLNKKFVELCELIFKDIYTVDSDSNDEDPAFATGTDFSHNTTLEAFLEEPLDILDPGYVNNNDEDLDQLITTYSEKLILTIDAINTLFASEEFMQFRFSLRQNEEQTLGFVETAIKLFLSYTAQLYSSEFKREYRTPSESTPLSESLAHTLNTNKTDYLYYDEQLDIQRTEGDG